MNIVQAALYTLDIVSNSQKWPKEPKELTEQHVSWMLERIINQEVKSYKAHRWLGWTQAAVVAVGAATPEYMEHINAADV